jgi:hypothetical protein
MALKVIDCLGLNCVQRVKQRMVRVANLQGEAQGFNDLNSQSDRLLSQSLLLSNSSISNF